MCIGRRTLTAILLLSSGKTLLAVRLSSSQSRQISSAIQLISFNVVRMNNVIHLRVRRENFESPLTTEQQNHPSETALDHVVPDFLIVNDGTLEDLYNKVCNLVVDRYGVCA